jgi:hypothetical protein
LSQIKARHVFRRIERDDIHTVFNKQVDVNLLEGDTHAGAFDIRKHDKLDVCRRFIVVELVLASSIGNEAKQAFPPVSFASFRRTASPTCRLRRPISVSCS